MHSCRLLQLVIAPAALVVGGFVAASGAVQGQQLIAVAPLQIIRPAPKRIGNPDLRTPNLLGNICLSQAGIIEVGNDFSPVHTLNIAYAIHRVNAYAIFFIAKMIE